MPRTHKLKTWPSFFEAIQRGEKTFEIRKNDRDFAIGDTLLLEEWDPGNTDASHDAFRYTGRKMEVVVTYIIHGGRCGIEPAYCVMGIRVPVMIARPPTP